jgi:hypothetical protein
MQHFDVTGSIDELRPGHFIVRAFAVRSWEQFSLQRAALTSAPVRTRAEAESRLERLKADLRSVFDIPEGFPVP